VVVGLSPPVRARLRQWCDEHLKHVAKWGKVLSATE
jgi:hypothetical protein